MLKETVSGTEVGLWKQNLCIPSEAVVNSNFSSDFPFTECTVLPSADVTYISNKGFISKIIYICNSRLSSNNFFKHIVD